MLLYLVILFFSFITLFFKGPALAKMIKTTVTTHATMARLRRDHPKKKAIPW